MCNTFIGWSGESCDKEYSRCSDDICDNQGVCVDSIYGYIIYHY